MFKGSLKTTPQGKPAAFPASAAITFTTEALFLTAACQSDSTYQPFQTRRTVIDQSVNQVRGAPAGLLKARALWLF